MTKFSAKLEDDGEGPSQSNRLKRRRYLSPPSSENLGEEQHQTGETSSPSPPESSNARDGARVNSSKDGSVIMSLTEPEVLDCTICYEPLTIPVFQCENGHIACSQCCTRIRNRCPSCALPIGYSRCRAIEKVIESVRTSCRNVSHGCKETMPYSKKYHHEQICSYSPQPCPFSSCSYHGLYKQFSVHYSTEHPAYLKHFKYNCAIHIEMNRISHDPLILQEDKGDLFVIRNHFEIVGNAVTLCFFGPSSTMGQYFYSLKVKTAEGTILQINSRAENKLTRPGSGGTFFLVPRDFFGADGHITLYVRIYRKSAGRGL